MQRTQAATVPVRRSDAPAQRANDHAGLTGADRQRFAGLVHLLERSAAALGERMADVGRIEIVQGAEHVSVHFRPHRSEGIHTLVGAFELRLTHEAKAAIHMRIRTVVPPAEVLDFDRVTAERLDARLRVFEQDCRRLPQALAA